MEDKEAMLQLVAIIEKYPLSEVEKEAVKHALGVLSWTSLRKGALQSMKDKHTRDRAAFKRR